MANINPDPILVKSTYSQPSDSCGPNEDDQFIEIEKYNAGQGDYIVLKTERWAFDPEELDAFIRMIKTVIK
jgi:hypothetical protein